MERYKESFKMSEDNSLLNKELETINEIILKNFDKFNLDFVDKQKPFPNNINYNFKKFNLDEGLISVFKYKDNFLIKGFYKTIVDTGHSVRGSKTSRAQYSPVNKFKTTKSDSNIENLKNIQDFLIKFFNKIK